MLKRTEEDVKLINKIVSRDRAKAEQTYYDFTATIYNTKINRNISDSIFFGFIYQICFLFCARFSPIALICLSRTKYYTVYWNE